jgi:UTP--glucose-1-phosphate uridylyltransferase
MQSQIIKKAVFPVAGLGTRFLPATKASPKEMLNVVDKPLIQYAVEEAINSGITELIFITGRNKRAIEDHFDKAYELEAELLSKNKLDLLNLVQSVKPNHVNCIYIRQAEALGLGHAILCAEKIIGEEAFAIFLADDLLISQIPVMQQMIDIYTKHKANIIGVEKILPQQSINYGVIKGEKINQNLFELTDIVEKPTLDKAPSNFGVVGRYILSHKIFDFLKQTKAGAGGEIQLTDAIASLLKHEKVLAYAYDGVRYDCGSKIGYLKASVDLALQHFECKEEFSQFLAKKYQI